MIAFDTHLVVRLLVEDDELQAAQARRVLEDASEPILITDIVLAEIEWVLDSVYDAARGRILAALGGLATDGRFRFEDRARVTEALGLYARGRGDLADYLLGLRGESAGARTTYTFDRGLRDEPRFTWLGRSARR